MSIYQFTAVIERDEDWYVALCPELDIASEGRTVEEARSNLIEAIELFFEVASPNEVQVHCSRQINPHPRLAGQRLGGSRTRSCTSPRVASTNVS